MTAVVEFARASRWYGPVIGLNDVTVRLEPGVTGLLGPNGAGKSTFLKLASGQLAPSQGAVTLFGRPAWGTPEVFHRVGVCAEADAFWDRLTGRQFLVALLRLTGFDDAECRRRADQALETVDLQNAA
ncbi:MAG TPA: ATP-binding cassette domain-containing protein, partial [Vicinamibacteria bacterium]